MSHLSSRVVCGAVAALAGTALGQNVVINFEGNSAGGLYGQSGPGGTWHWVQDTDRVDIQVVTDRVSPIGGGTRAVKYTPGSGSSRLGVDLGAVFNASSGVVKVQWDVYTSEQFAQGSYRLLAMNNDLDVDGTTAQNVATIQAQMYVTGGGGQYNQGMWASVGNSGASFNDNIITRNRTAGACEGKWYRMAYYYDFDQPQVPMVYAEMYDIDNGQLTKVGEWRDGDSALQFNIGSTDKSIRSIALRAPGSQNEEFYVDNITVAAVPGFSLPQPPIALNDAGDPAPLPRPDLRSEVTETAVMEVDLGDTIGDLPSMTMAGSTLWMLDGGFGLQSWDTVTRPPAATYVDPALGIDFAPNPSSVMVANGDGSGLYVWANTIGLGSLNTAGWRDLAFYDIGAGVWSMLIDGDVVTNTADGAIGRAVVNGQEVIYSAWLGATQYTGFNVTRRSSAPAITGVGNRWAGAVTEGRQADELFVLANTDAAGNRQNLLTGQQYQGLYRTTWVPGCVNSSAILRRISPSAQVVPWVLACNDGGCVNRASMQYVAATNCIWLSRAANTNDLGVYDLDTDTWGVVHVNLPDGSPLSMENVDLQLVGDRMFLYSQDQTAVYSVDAMIDGSSPCIADFNGDGFVDFFDYDDYVNCFETGSCPPGKTADVNGDDFVDFFDYDDYVNAFETGC